LFSERRTTGHGGPSGHDREKKYAQRSFRLAETDGEPDQNGDEQERRVQRRSAEPRLTDQDEMAEDGENSEQDQTFA
jgi:hypothetical protein